MNSRFLDMLSGEEPDATPIWLMRQAGRYLPGYRKLRETHDILELAKDPDLAAQVAEEPLTLFDLDAAIVFADIIHPLEGLGVEVRLDAGQGPRIENPVRGLTDLARLRTPLDAEGQTGFVGQTIRRLRERTDRPVIGFSASPFTLACYLVQGRHERDFPAMRRLLSSDPEFVRQLMMVLSAATIEYVQMQERAGAHAIQIFDTWAGILSADQYATHVSPYLGEILTSVDVPTIYFSTGSSHLLPLESSLGATALSVDWRVPLDEVHRVTGDGTVLQGNLDPAALLGTPESLESAAREVLSRVPSGAGHIFNLGHGVLPETDPQQVKRLVDLVHAASRE